METPSRGWWRPIVRLLIAVTACFLLSINNARMVVKALPVASLSDSVGCLYDLTLCQSNEVCFDDSLFGSCVRDAERDGVSYADFSDEQLQQLRALMHELVGEGRSWHDFVVQCTVGRLLDGFVANEQVDLDACVDIEQKLEREVALTAAAARDAQMQQALDALVYTNSVDAPDRAENSPMAQKFFKLLAAANPAHLKLADAEPLRNGDHLVPITTKRAITTMRADRESHRGQRELGWPPYDNGENDSGAAAKLLLSHGAAVARQPVAQLARFDVREQLPASLDAASADDSDRELLLELINQAAAVADASSADDDQPSTDSFDPRKAKRSTVELLNELAGDSDSNDDDDIEEGLENYLLLQQQQQQQQPQNDDNENFKTIVFPVDDGNNDNDDDGLTGLMLQDDGTNYVSDDTHLGGMNKKDREHVAFGANGVNLGPNLVDAEVVRQKWADAAALLALPEMSGVVTPEELWQDGALKAPSAGGENEKDKMLNDPNYELVDASYVYMDVDRTPTYDEIRSLLSAISYIMEIPPTTFSDIRFSGTHITFRVSPFLDRTNATLVARVLDQDYVQKTAKEMLNLNIVATGIEARPLGTYSSLRSGELVIEQLQAIDIPVSESRGMAWLTLAVYVVGVCFLLGMTGTLALYVIGRRKRTRRRLADLLARDHEAGSDVYKDLCRQHMASKQGVEGPATKTTTSTTTITKTSPPGSKNNNNKQRNGSDRSSTSSWSDEPVKMDMDINTGHRILNYMEDLLKDRNRIDKEWSSLCKYEAEPNKIDVGSRSENTEKNRYFDIIPYDHTRVPLNAENNASKSDYINASFVTDSDPKCPMYISTQGPLASTIVDFWQMVWEQGTSTIVCLTRMRDENDEGSELCHQYWRQETSAVAVYYTFEVRLVSEHSWCDDYVVRSFYLKNTKSNETRTVTQFHFKSWPHLGTPASARPLLEFRRKINKSFHTRSHPIIIHDSDGCDRAGSFILLDMVLSRMAKGVVKQVDVAATLEHIRDQRMQMVRTKEQFEFVITAIAEEVQAILKSLQ